MTRRYADLHQHLDLLRREDLLLTIDTQAISERAVRIEGQFQERAGGLLGTLARWPVDQTLEAQFGATVERNEQLLSVALEKLRLPLSGQTLNAQGNISYASDSKTLTVHELVILTGENYQKLRGGYSPLDMWADVDLDQFPLELLSPWIEDLQSGDVSGTAELNWLHQEEG